MHNLPTKRNSGIDNIDNKLLKELKEFIAPTLTAIFNNSIENDVFPSQMKTAKVVSLFKTKERDETTN